MHLPILRWFGAWCVGKVQNSTQPPMHSLQVLLQIHSILLLYGHCIVLHYIVGLRGCLRRCLIPLLSCSLHLFLIFRSNVTLLSLLERSNIVRAPPLVTPLLLTAVLWKLPLLSLPCASRSTTISWGLSKKASRRYGLILIHSNSPGSNSPMTSPCTIQKLLSNITNLAIFAICPSLSINRDAQFRSL